MEEDKVSFTVLYFLHLITEAYQLGLRDGKAGSHAIINYTKPRTSHVNQTYNSQED